MSPFKISIAPLLKQLTSNQLPPNSVLAAEISSAISYLFDDQLSSEQCASLLTCLRLLGLEEDPHIVAACAQSMRNASSKINSESLRLILASHIKSEGSYHGGLCDIVGTGGDGHSTFNISTTASIVCSALLAVAKHGSQASSSKSGSADVLMALQPISPNIEAVTADNIQDIYVRGKYGFLFAKQFHPGMKYVAPIRKEIGFRTIFNILGPLANPLYKTMEAGVYGVYKKSLGPVYADALKRCGAQKAMVVCGDEDLDEISCAGKTHCWRLIMHEPPEGVFKQATATIDQDLADDSQAISVQYFELEPSDFGLPRRSLDEVFVGGGPKANAEVLTKLLNNQLPRDDPTLEFVLMNAAALFVISGICDANISQMGAQDDGIVINEVGPGGGRWKEGVRRARWAIEHGAAIESLNEFIRTTSSFRTGI